ncbi:hypothetical protein NPIL_400671 [Nephila pilipes]|uniref:Uncharacterized protein n=1 Tax=Nephila pilipes TaxID=299642 RepID=A0A8X6NSS2_NEPPI|nr:hypothetical protein NPIL_400671 [Nephila pilipes]
MSLGRFSLKNKKPNVPELHRTCASVTIRDRLLELRLNGCSTKKKPLLSEMLRKQSLFREKIPMFTSFSNNGEKYFSVTRKVSQLGQISVGLK